MANTIRRRRARRNLESFQGVIPNFPDAGSPNHVRFLRTPAIDMSPTSSKHELPPLAGVASLTEAMKPGLSVEECVRRLKRYHYAFKRLHQIFTARITAEPSYELKMQSVSRRSLTPLAANVWPDGLRCSTTAW